MPHWIPPQTWQTDVAGHPLLAGFGAVASALNGTDWPSLAQLNHLATQRGVQNSAGLPIQFSRQDQPCGQRAYETDIARTGRVPTRTQNWHDLFNACVWLTYPKLKAALNAVHCQQPAGPQRSPASDAATVFDESGAVLLGPDPRLPAWLRAHAWEEAFVTHRDLWTSHRLLIIGHAVLEKTLAPYPGMISKVIYHPWPALSGELSAVPADLDAALARRWLAGEFSQPVQLFPVPVFGIPGVDPANAAPRYYTNTAVFRPLRRDLLAAD